MDSFSATLADLSDDEWARPALRDLHVQGLVGHLIGVEHDFQVALGLQDAEDSDSPTDHVASTQLMAAAQEGRAPSDTRHDWLLTASRTADRVSAFDDDRLGANVSLHGITFSVDAMLIVRSFEMWTHEEDIRRATGRPLAAPEAARLSLMTQLAVSLLPAGMMRAERPVDRTVRLVLTGPGGGTWPAAVAGQNGELAEARLVIDAVSFCRVVANRMEPADAGAWVSGDQALARDVLDGARTLALD
jgi:uncharacterized protein (TIGR03083 family)